jgi:hypothetical protein
MSKTNGEVDSSKWLKAKTESNSNWGFVKLKFSLATEMMNVFSSNNWDNLWICFHSRAKLLPEMKVDSYIQQEKMLGQIDQYWDETDFFILKNLLLS